MGLIKKSVYYFKNYYNSQIIIIFTIVKKLNTMNPVLMYNDMFEKWSANNHTIEEIKHELRSIIDNDLHIEEIVNAYTTNKSKRRIQRGFLFTAIGAVICFLSVIFTVFDLAPEYRSFFLIWLTVIGLAIILAGFYLIFEK